MIVSFYFFSSAPFKKDLSFVCCVTVIQIHTFSSDMVFDMSEVKPTSFKSSIVFVILRYLKKKS